jgi:hypothetical protein
MPVKTLSIPYHSQLDLVYCGPACIQMVVEGSGAVSPGQDVLYTKAHTHGGLDPVGNWASPPDGVDWTLDGVLAANTFNVLTLSSEATLTRRIVWSIFNNSSPCIALVYGWAHWLTVVGYDITADPTKKTDTTYTINALDLQDPWRTEAEGPAPPPPPPRHVTFQEWKRTYLEPVPHGYWKGKVLAIGNFGPTPRSAAMTDDPGDIVVPAFPAPIIPPSTAKARAMGGLEQWGLLTRDDWKRVWAGGAIDPGEPLLVQRLDDQSFYYLVPIGSPKGTVRAVVRVDAFSGEYLETSAVSAADTHDSRSWGTRAADLGTEAATRAKVAGQRIPLPDLGGRLLPPPEGVGVHPSFVWRPCRESLSPIMPFRLITIGDRLFYLRLDDVLFDSLHDATPGM